VQVRSRIGGRVQSGLTLLALTLAALTPSTSAVAQRDRGAGPAHGRGDISRLHQRDRNTWRGGHWNYGRHDGHLGWWWGVGGLWYLYPSPVYPYPYPYPYSYSYSIPWEPPLALASPPESAVPAVPPTSYWYFCEASGAYYPYVATCPGGWRPVPATPADASPVPPQ
jgi:hypothetical protein